MQLDHLAFVEQPRLMLTGRQGGFVGISSPTKIGQGAVTMHCKNGLWSNMRAELHCHSLLKVTSEASFKLSQYGRMRAGLDAFSVVT